MKQTLFILTTIVILLTLTACDGIDKILQTNVFSELGKVSTKEIKNASADELVELGKSDSFFKTLNDDPGLTQEVLATIDSAITGSSDPGTRQNLNILAAEIHLQTSGGATLVNNIANLLSNPSGFEDISDPEGFFVGLLPAGIVVNGKIQESAFVALINGFVAANTYYEGLNVALSGGYKDPDVNPGEVAQNAIVAAIISSIADAASGSSTPGKNLYDAITGDSPTISEPDFGILFDSSGPIGDILIAAGLEGFGN